MSEDEAAAARAIVADSAEEYTDKSRLRSLFKARDEAASAIRQASMKQQQFQRRASGPTTDDEQVRRTAQRLANEWVYENVVAYVIECEPLLRNSEEGQQLLNDRMIHEWHIRGTSVGFEQWNIQSAPGTVVEKGDQTVVQIIGLGEYLDSPTVITHHEETVKKHDGYTTNEDTVRWAIDRRVSEDVFRKLNVLMANLGIGLEAEQEDVDDVAEFDYSDLI